MSITIAQLLIAAIGILVLIALFAGGHVLLEGVPGLGKTLLVRTLGMCCRCGSTAFSSRRT